MEASLRRVQDFRESRLVSGRGRLKNINRIFYFHKGTNNRQYVVSTAPRLWRLQAPKSFDMAGCFPAIQNMDNHLLY